MSKNETSFTETGFNNWKDGASRIEGHSLSAAHGAAANYIAQQNRPSVATQVSTQLAKDQGQNRKRLITELNAIIFLMRQGLALRRWKDETNDNLHQVLQLLARSEVAEVEACLNRRLHSSYDMKAELCKPSLEQL